MCFWWKIESTENSLQAIIRELNEELDVEVPSSELIFISAYTEEISQHKDLIYGYFWHDKNNTIQTCHEGEIAYFNALSDILKNNKLLDDVPFLLSTCKNKKLI